ncbi:hypothetical protein N9D31_02025 [Oligoflexaceae bacterium]|nr:hypothetical protein [Oligoflexaceae bacterium]
MVSSSVVSSPFVELPVDEVAPLNVPSSSFAVSLVVAVQAAR